MTISERSANEQTCCGSSSPPAVFDLPPGAYRRKTWFLLGNLISPMRMGWAHIHRSKLNEIKSEATGEQSLVGDEMPIGKSKK